MDKQNKITRELLIDYVEEDEVGGEKSLSADREVSEAGLKAENIKKLANKQPEASDYDEPMTWKCYNFTTGLFNFRETYTFQTYFIIPWIVYILAIPAFQVSKLQSLQMGKTTNLTQKRNFERRH